MPFKFKIRLVPMIATLVVAVIGSLLGRWQLHRAAEKEAIERSMTARATLPAVDLAAGLPADVEYRRVRVTGVFDAAWPVYLDNRPYQGRAGFYAVMPMRIEGTQEHVAVARGWLPRDNADRTRVPPLSTPAGTVTIEGRAVMYLPRVMQLGQDAPLRPGAIVQNLEPAALAAGAGLKMLPVIIEQEGDGAPNAGDGLVRDWPSPSTGVSIDRHRGYAVQWFGLAATAILFFFVTGFRSGRNRE